MTSFDHVVVKVFNQLSSTFRRFNFCNWLHYINGDVHYFVREFSKFLFSQFIEYLVCRFFKCEIFYIPS